MLCEHPQNLKDGRRVPCGRCIACRVNRSQEWRMRLLHELDYEKDALFLTLTYGEEYLPDKGSLSILDLQRFNKRLRKEFVDRKIRYYACGEYGDNFDRPHYHGIYFGLSVVDGVRIDPVWGKGFIRCGTVNKDSIGYVTGYITKKLWGPRAKEVYAGRRPPFSVMSKGFGRRWFDDNIDHVLQNMGIRSRGKVIRAPRYYMRQLADVIPEELKDEVAAELGERSLELARSVGIDPKDVGLWDHDRRAQVSRDLRTKLGWRKPRL